VNGIDYGVMVSDLPTNDDMFFTTDLTDAGQRVSICAAERPK
jgi:hypothetical protein